MPSIPLALIAPPGTVKSEPESASPAGTAAIDFREVYARHFRFVWRNLGRLGVPAAQMNDAAQDVFLVVHRRLPGFEGRSTLETWLFGIVLRVASRYRRTAARRPTEALTEHAAGHPGSSPEELTEAVRAARLLEQMLDELDEDQRTVFVLVELEQLTAPEISAALGVNLNTVYSRLRTARRNFDAALARHRSRRPQ